MQPTIIFIINLCTDYFLDWLFCWSEVPTAQGDLENQQIKSQSQRTFTWEMININWLSK